MPAETAEVELKLTQRQYDAILRALRAQRQAIDEHIRALEARPRLVPKNN